MLISHNDFVNVPVLLDGNEFEKCRFINATLVYGATAPTTIRDCELIGVRFELVGPAALTLSFLSGLYVGFGEDGRQFVEEVFGRIRSGEVLNPSGQLDPKLARALGRVASVTREAPKSPLPSSGGPSDPQP